MSTYRKSDLLLAIYALGFVMLYCEANRLTEIATHVHDNR